VVSYLILSAVVATLFVQLEIREEQIGKLARGK